ncbi:AraC family transcriptional regulator [Burkholderia plantarii]|uniref:AraC family transcriptional regulator n=1 Tax=Burkholderia plantarii TaxID=41899 RepID=UPI0018DB7269|nr:helix-turn-helix transcriptional regulator [Burkholderia plantarii]MBI0328410.1 helix-turn-helix transcriptional regulator [Burkholderia plantarii]
MHDPLLPPLLVLESGGPLVAAAELTQAAARATDAHRHRRGQLVGALSGLLSVGLETQQWVVPATHAIWVPPHHLHSLRSYGPFSGWSVFVEEAACATLPAAPRAIRANPLLREAARRAATWSGGPLGPDETRIAELILAEITASPAQALGLPRPVEARVARIADALAADLSDNRGAEAWARWAGIAPRTLSRRFVAETGLSFAQWRQQARVLRALERLADGTPVTTIALELGYDNVSAFIEMFRRVLGVTPGKYAAGLPALAAA